MIVIRSIFQFVTWGVTAIIVAAIVLIVLRSIFNYLDVNPFSWPAVTLRRSTEPILEQVMRLQLGEGLRAPPLAVAQDAGNRDLGVVVEDRPRHAAEEREGLDVAVAEGLGSLLRIRHHEAGV